MNSRWSGESRGRLNWFGTLMLFVAVLGGILCIPAAILGSLFGGWFDDD